LDCDNQEYVVRSLGILTPEPLECPALYPGQVNVLFHQNFIIFYSRSEAGPFFFFIHSKKVCLQ
jgi:hypothetical protein